MSKWIQWCLLVAMACGCATHETPAPPPEKEMSRIQPELSSERRLSGDDTGKIVLVEYADFQCPACQMAYESLKPFQQKHRGDIQFYYKNMPLPYHKMASPAAQYFEAIRLQDKAKALKFLEYVFEYQQDLGTEGFLKIAAGKAGADLKRVEQDIQSELVQKRIAQDVAEFRKFNFAGTPVLVVNGVALSGAPPPEVLEQIVEMRAQK